MRTNAGIGRWTRREWVVFLLCMGAALLVLLSIAVPAIQRARTGAWPIMSGTQMRNILLGIHAFEKDRGRALTLDEWPDALVSAGYVESDWLFAPGERGPEPTYTYVPLAPGETRDARAMRVMLYENFDWFDDGFANVAFEDTRIEMMDAEGWRIAVETGLHPDIAETP